MAQETPQERLKAWWTLNSEMMRNEYVRWQAFRHLDAALFFLMALRTLTDEVRPLRLVRWRDFFVIGPVECLAHLPYEPQVVYYTLNAEGTITPAGGQASYSNQDLFSVEFLCEQLLGFDSVAQAIDVWQKQARPVDVVCCEFHDKF